MRTPSPTPDAQLGLVNACALERCQTWLREADYILIGAGSGLSVDAGIDYTDTAFFARRFPAMAKHQQRHDWSTRANLRLFCGVVLPWRICSHV
ncbi:MAG: hypothetical protein LAQ69_46760 [Acidobacteriia bacterium]|nr:hypothetical protein [Terriglobia bacterium]